jgi:hypothetical protein
MKKLSIFSLIVSLLFVFSCEDKKDTTPPELTIVSPTSGSTVGETVQIKVQTTDESGILKVDFYIQNSMVLSDTTLPYEYEWNTTTNLDGEYKVKVVSFDTKENFIESEFSVTVDNESKKPSVTEIDSIKYSYEKESFEIYWTKNTDNDFKSYSLYESENEDMSSKKELTVITDQNINYYDTPINSGLTKYYQIEVEDNYGLKSQSNIKKGKSIIMFVKTIDIDTHEIGRSIKQTSDNGFIISGTSRPWSSNDNDGLLMKTDISGNKDWSKIFSKGEFHDIEITSDGKYLLTGFKDKQPWLIKTDITGSPEINVTLCVDCDFNNYNYKSFSGKETTDGGFILTGYDGKGSIFLIKTDHQGNKTWERNLESGIGYDVQQTTDGGFIITGFKGDMNVDLVLIKTNSEGEKDWSKTFVGGRSERGRSVIQTTDGGYVVVGYTNSFGVPSEDNIWLIKTDSNGNEEWNKTFGESGVEYGFSVQETSDNGFILIGHINYQNIYLIKTDSQGNLVWDNKTYEGLPWDIDQTSDGGFVIVGRTTNNSNYNLLLIKTDSEGNIE